MNSFCCLYKYKTKKKSQIFKSLYGKLGASLVAQTVNNPPTIGETWIQSLVWEDLLEKKMATHSSILAWKIPWRKSLVGYSPWGRKESDRTERLFTNTTYVASLIAQLAKNLPAIQETSVPFLGREDPLEKGQATHSSILGLPLWFSW